MCSTQRALVSITLTIVIKENANTFARANEFLRSNYPISSAEDDTNNVFC
jgi:hypothetical protein